MNQTEAKQILPPSRWRRWFLALLFAGALAGIVLHFAEIEQFAQIVRHARPGWMLVALTFQMTTYFSVAAGWASVLHKAGTPLPFRRLLRIALTKLFADQALPSGGMGGNVLLVDQLTSAGADRGTAVAALLLSIIGYYIAYAALALLALVLLWWHSDATPLLVGLVTLLLVVALAIPSLALWLRRRGTRRLPHAIEGIGLIRSLMEAVADAPASLIRDRRLVARVAACNAAVFLADAGTMLACLRALGQEAAASTAFVAFVMASIVSTLGPIPMGLGSFEATATAMLRLFRVPFEAAITATLLFRVLTLWLPLLPGMVLMRKALRPGNGAGRES